jgi:hypothetical protein
VLRVPENTCGKPGGALIAALGDETAHPADVDPASWTFSTPADDTMTGATLWRAGDADGEALADAEYEFWFAGPSEFSRFDGCAYEFKCPTSVGDPAEPLSEANHEIRDATEVRDPAQVSKLLTHLARFGLVESTGAGPLTGKAFAWRVTVVRTELLQELERRTVGA